MRVLHTSDWHIGRTFHGHSTLEALSGVLQTLVERVRELRVDVVVVSGDVFDTATPSPAAYTLLTDVLVALADAGARVIVSSGNHDSAARLGFQARLLRPGIHVVTDPATIGAPILIDDEHTQAGPVAFYPLPFLDPVTVRALFSGVPMRTQADALAHAMSLVRDDRDRRGGRSVVMAHCFATPDRAQAESADDRPETTPNLERVIQQGGLEFVPASVFDGPDYVALGHIHGRSRLSDRVRYSGAPLHYSFGERRRMRGAWLVELDEHGLAAVDWVELPVPRPLVTLEAPFADLLADPAFARHEHDWVSARYTDDQAIADPMRRLLQRFPHCALVQHVPTRTAGDTEQTYAARVAHARDHADLVDDFLSHVRGGTASTEQERELVRAVIDECAAARSAV